MRKNNIIFLIVSFFLSFKLYSREIFIDERIGRIVFKYEKSPLNIFSNESHKYLMAKTGFLISKSCVLTSGHGSYPPDQMGWIRRNQLIQFNYPGFGYFNELLNVNGYGVDTDIPEGVIGIPTTLKTKVAIFTELNYRLNYFAKTMPGDSGAPVIYHDKVIGIHTGLGPWQVANGTFIRTNQKLREAIIECIDNE